MICNVKEVAAISEISKYQKVSYHKWRTQDPRQLLPTGEDSVVR